MSFQNHYLAGLQYKVGLHICTSKNCLPLAVVYKCTVHSIKSLAANATKIVFKKQYHCQDISVVCLLSLIS